MTKASTLKGLVLFLVAAFVVSACGQAAAPAATPVPIKASGTPTAAAATAPTPVPGTSAATAVPGSTGRPAYPPDLVKKYVAENFFLPGMQAGAGQQQQYGGMATFSNRADLVSGDSNDYASISSENMLAMIYNNGNLVRPKPSNTFEAEPALAESWTVNDDYTTWTWKLRQGIKWHDGTPLLAEDVKFWVDYGNTPPAGRKANSTIVNLGIKEAQIVDERTVKFIMKGPAPFLLELIWAPALPIYYPKHLAQPVIDKGNVNVNFADVNWVGLGPFRFDSYNKGSSVKGVRNEQYWEKDAAGGALPYLDSIYYPIIPDATVAQSAFRAGRIDGTSRGTSSFMSPDAVTNIKKTLGDKAWFYRMPYLGWGLSMNATKPPFNDLRLRQALSLYTDRERVKELDYGGFALPNGLMQPGSYYWNPEAVNWPGYSKATKAADQAKAKQLMQEAGAVGTPVTITCRDVYLTHCEMGDLFLKELGFQNKIEVVDTLKNTEMSQTGRHMMSLNSFSPALPNSLLITMLTTNPLNVDKFGDTKIDEFHKQITTTVDPVKRRELTWAAERYVAVDQAYAQTWVREEGVVAYRSYIKGIWIPYTTVHDNNAHTWTWFDKSLK